MRRTAPRDRARSRRRGRPRRRDRDPRRRRGPVRSRDLGSGQAPPAARRAARRCSSRATGSSATSTRRRSCRRRAAGTSTSAAGTASPRATTASTASRRRDFLTFGDRRTIIEHGVFQHVCNVSADRAGRRLARDAVHDVPRRERPQQARVLRQPRRRALERLAGAARRDPRRSDHHRRLRRLRRRRHQRHERPAPRGRQVPHVLLQLPRRREGVPRERRRRQAIRVRRRRARPTRRSSTT